MTQDVLQVEEAVKRFSAEELAAFRAWFAEHDAQLWDAQLERDAATGKLDWLRDEARRDLEQKQELDRRPAELDANPNDVASWDIVRRDLRRRYP